ncbi:hypothetical protein ACOMHN_052494 [Nucella lapillus]
MVKRKLSTSEDASPVSAAGEDWSSDEKLALMVAMRSQCPDLDKLSFTSQISKVDWNKVEVEGRTPEQCQEAWQNLSAKVRKFRTLGELMEDAKDMIVHPEKYPNKRRKLKVSKLKHPDRPTKPLTPFFSYIQDHREKFKAKHPDVSHIDFIRLISQKWQCLTSSKQSKYIKKYQTEQAAFLEANAKFLEEHPELNQRIPQPRPPTPYGTYMKSKMPAYKEKHPEMDNFQVQNNLRHKFAQLSPGKKRKWIQKAMDAVPDFEEKVRAYQRVHPDFEPPTKTVVLTKKEAALNGDVNESQKKTKKVKLFPGAPKKPPRSAYQIFTTKKMQTLEGSLKEKMQAISQLWQDMGHKQKKYVKKLNKQKQRYEQDLQAFRETLTAAELAAFDESLKPQKRTTTKKKKKQNEKLEDAEQVPSLLSDEYHRHLVSEMAATQLASLTF